MTETEGSKSSPQPEAEGANFLREKLDTLRNRRLIYLQDFFAAPARLKQGEAIDWGRRRMLDGFLQQVGSRLSAATFSNYKTRSEEQAEKVQKIWNYGLNLDCNVALGRNVIICGGTGTGKDHLLTALAKYSILKHGAIVHFARGHKIISQAAEDQFSGFGRLVGQLLKPEILYISDPWPPDIEIPPAGTRMLSDVIDARYSECKPTWISSNFVGTSQMEAAIGDATVDRLFADCPLGLLFDWDSYRTGGR